MKSIVLTIALALTLSACGGQSQTDSANPAPGPDELSAAQLENGVGPYTSVELTDIDSALATTGEEVFVIKCSACHRMTERYVGPALGGITDRRAPAYILNMIMNPEEMVQRHPEARKLFAQFMTPMPNQHLTEDEARAVLEYLRTQQAP